MTEKHVQIVDAHGDMAWSLLKFSFFLTNVSHIGEVIARGSTPYRRRLARKSQKRIKRILF